MDDGRAHIHSLFFIPGGFMVVTNPTIKASDPPIFGPAMLLMISIRVDPRRPASVGKNVIITEQ